MCPRSRRRRIRRPGAAMSSNLEYLARVPDAAGITEGKFDRVRGNDVLVITGRFGFKTYDVSDPADPEPLDDVPARRARRGRLLAERGHGARHAPQADHRRARPAPHRARADRAAPAATATRSPTRAARAASTSSRTPTRRTCGRSATSSRCPRATRRAASRTAATSGPAARRARTTGLRSGWLGPISPPTRSTNRLVGDGRPIWVTDLRNPNDPKVSDEPVDLWRNDGYTDYSHDVDEDDQGIAWVSGRGGIRGYATSGRHRDPYQNRVRRATPFDPILVAGGGVAGTAQPVMLMHNSGRPTDGSVQAAGDQEGQRPGRHRGGLHDAVRRERQDRRSPTSPTLGRRARAALDAGARRTG